SLFAVEGWVPKNKIDKLNTIVEDLDVHIVEIAVESDEIVPTYLENKGVNRIGEDLVNIYDTPSNIDRDPSLWVLVSFAIFFAMIIRDGGYGLVFLAAALYFRYKNPKIRNTSKRVWKLCVLLFSSCILWGILTHSFFGINFAPDSIVKKVSVLNWLVDKKVAYHMEKKDPVYKEWMDAFPELEKAQTSEQFLLGTKKEANGKITYKMHDAFTDEIMMELALLAGIIHISLSFLRYLDRNWSGIGWIIAIIGCYLSFPKLLQATTMAHYVLGFDRDLIAQEGLYMIYCGLSLAIILAIIKHKALGLLEITNLIQIFGDILSYLRLYALGLAGSIISGIVNDLAGSMIFMGGILLLILGHSLNMALAIIGGIIHGLRLNFIEWYHYSFEGGGKRFNPLRKMKVE
ncbi:MAG: V-type ATPase 116kDa subunit family protein, partial [Waddliaceae bacterium]